MKWLKRLFIITLAATIIQVLGLSFGRNPAQAAGDGFLKLSALTVGTAAFPTAAGTSGNVLTSNGTNWTSAAPTAGTPGGANTQVQFNNAGSFGGSASLTWNGTALGAADIIVGGGTTISKINFGVDTLPDANESSVTVALTGITANARILATYGPTSAVLTTLGYLSTAVGTNEFTITARGSVGTVGQTSTVFWLVIEP